MLVGDPGEDKEGVGSGYYIAEVNSLLFKSGAGEVWPRNGARVRKRGGCVNIISVCCLSGANQRSCVVFRCNRGSVLNFCAICAFVHSRRV